MQWGHIKTLFIISFLLLNLYLVIQLFDRQNTADMNVLDHPESTIEEQLESENITIEAALETEFTEASYTEVTQKRLSSDDMNELGGMDDQTAAVINNNFIVSVFDEPISLPTPYTPESISSEVKNHILYADEYELWGWNTDTNMLLFFQHYEDRPVYFNQNGLLLVYLNEENEMTHYTQTILGEGEAQGGAKNLIQPIQAVGSLYNRGDLRPDETVTEISLGNYARIATEGVQVFAPTWKVTVETNENEERHYFINAIEGLVFESESTVFLTDVMQDQLSKIRTLSDDSEIRDYVEEQLEIRLERENQSEGE
jgi:regulatory protein YycI of two-component signal transduction system YycFG